MQVDGVAQRNGRINFDSNSTKITSAAPVRNNIQNQGLGQEDMNDEKFQENMIKQSMDKANKELERFNRRVEYQVHEKTKTVMFKITDTRTGEVIKEIPPEKIQDMIAKMWELAGLFVDEQA